MWRTNMSPRAGALLLLLASVSAAGTEEVTWLESGGGGYEPPHSQMTTAERNALIADLRASKRALGDSAGSGSAEWEASAGI